MKRDLRIDLQWLDQRLKCLLHIFWFSFFVRPDEWPVWYCIPWVVTNKRYYRYSVIQDSWLGLLHILTLKTKRNVNRHSRNFLGQHRFQTQCPSASNHVSWPGTAQKIWPSHNGIPSRAYLTFLWTSAFTETGTPLSPLILTTTNILEA